MAIRIQKTHEFTYSELREALEIDGEIEKVVVDWNKRMLIVTTKETEESRSKDKDKGWFSIG